MLIIVDKQQRPISKFLNNDLKKDAINEFGIKYWTSNPVWVTFQEHGSSFYVNIEEKV
jgi:hypothetical protein